jgi:hypothetical protein
MPRLTFWTAGACAAALVAGCAGPIKTKTVDGLAYDCGDKGKAVIQFGGGGYLPGETAIAKGTQRLRSTARLAFREGLYDMVAEWTQGGLRYRSQIPFDGINYLVWTSGTVPEEQRAERWQDAGRLLTAEDARVGLRASADPLDEVMVSGEPFATCRRLGREPDDSAGEHHDDGDEHHGGADEHHHEGKDGEPHAR